jgi:regulator-associated protein of mTOR
MRSVDEEYSRGRSRQRQRSDSDTGGESADSLETFSPSVSNPSFGLIASEDSMPEVIPMQKPWLSKRHLTNGNPSPSQALHNRFHQWRLQDKLKTGNGAIVVCLNLDVDPPDVVKTQPCAVLEGWIDPRKLGSAKALEAIGKNLCQQFQSLNARIKYKPFLDPSIDEARRFCVNLRKTAKDERLCFYYNGHGVPKPTPSGELWVFNKTYSQYIPVSLYDLQTWLGSPVVFFWDCSAAGNLVQNLQKYAKQRDEAAMAKHGGNVDGSPPHSSAIQLAACLASETLPMAPDMPADIFTSCLTSPIEMALRFYYLHQNPPPGVTMDMLHEVPGDLKDRRTPLGELNWIFTAVTDTIAWTSFSRPIFKRLFRQDLLVAALFRNFLLAERIMRNYHCTPHTVPELPSTATHPLWAAWDRSVEDIIKQLPDLIKSARPVKSEPVEIVEGRQFVPLPFKYDYKSSSFFTDHLTAFELWMSRGGGALAKVGPWSMPPLEKLEDEVSTPNEDATQPELVPRKPPAQLPILLQVLLSQAHRMRALTLLCQFVDLGPWAVHLVLEIGIYPYVQKLLLSPQGDLKPLLIFIWSRLIAFDKSCQVDLLREAQFTYFATILDYSNPVGLAYTFEYRSMCAFILASLCRDHPPGQVACLAWNKGALLDFYLHHIVNSSDFLLKQWCCLAIAQLWDGSNDAKEIALDQGVQHQLLALLNEDASAEVRASALYALGIFCGASGSASAETNGGGGTGRMTQLSEEAHLDLELGTAVEAIKITKVRVVYATVFFLYLW